MCLDIYTLNRTEIASQSIYQNPQGVRMRGRSRQTLKRLFDEKLSKSDNSWKTVKALTSTLTMKANRPRRLVTPKGFLNRCFLTHNVVQMQTFSLKLKKRRLAISKSIRMQMYKRTGIEATIAILSAFIKENTLLSLFCRHRCRCRSRRHFQFILSRKIIL